jgi:tetratricopeptide (TPR) repeat protein
MKNKYLNLLVFFLLNISHASLSQVSDSVINVLNNLPGIEAKLDLLDALAKEEIRKNPDIAIEYYNEYINKAKEDNLPISHSYALKQIGIAWYYAEDIKKSTEFYFKALETLGDNSDYVLLARIYNNIGWNFQIENNLDLAIEYFAKAEEQANLSGNNNIFGLILNNLGVALKNKGDYEAALSAYKKSLAINVESDNKERQIFNLNNISILYLQLEDYNKSIEYLKRAKPLILQSNDSSEYVNYLITYGDVLLATNQYQKATDTIELGIMIAKKIGLVNKERPLHFKAYTAYEKQGKYKAALDHFQDYYELNVQYQEERNSEYINELNLKYNFAQKENELQLAKNENLQQRIYIVIITSVLFFAVLAILLVYRISRYRSKKNRELNSLVQQLSDSNQTIREQNEAIRQKSQQLNAANIEVQKANETLEKLVEERTMNLRQKNDRLIRYAHITAHDIRGPLARILGLVSICNDDSFEDFEKMSTMIKTAAVELDDIVRKMNNVLEDEDFEIPDKE